ncbi:MAG: FtsX-like permease family protein [Desulfobacterales bacterium]|nr:FtsX-like permease family protein [Desulfobacterales bacterium]
MWIFLYFFILSFLSIQIGILIGHRRHNYGMFLAKGMEWKQIYLMVWFQLFIATVMGTATAFATVRISASYIQNAVKPVAFAYRDTLNMADFNLLPLTYGNYIITSLIVFSVSCMLATVILYLMPLRQRTHPAVLL